MRTGGVMCVVVLALSLAPVRPAAAQAEPVVAIEQSTVGNVFAEGTAPGFRLTHSQGGTVEAHWVARPLAGDEVSGDIAVPPEGADLTVPVDEVGYYDLTVTPVGSGEPARSSFAVVPPVGDDGRHDVRFGMQTHFSQGYDPDLVGVLEAIGVATVRDSQPWQDMETCEGTPDPTPPCDDPQIVFPDPMETYMARLGAARIEPLINFGLGNQNYDAGPPDLTAYTPHTPEGRRAFGRFAARVLDHYRDTVAVDQVGVYNEPNLCRFGDWGERNDGIWDNGGTADAEPRPHRRIAGAIDGQVPEDVTVVGPDLFAPAGRSGRPPCNDRTSDWEQWLRDYFAAGALRDLDAVSLHPYRLSQAPEGLAQDQIAPVRDAIADFDTDDDPTTPPIWITEQGWRTDSHQSAVDEPTQAAYLPRTYVTALAEGVERFYWYNLKDHTSGAFGLVRQPLGDDPWFVDNTPKPALVAYAVMTDQLAGRDWTGRDADVGGVESHRFGSGDDPVRVMWDPEGRTEVTLTADEPVEVTDIWGRITTHRPDGQGDVRFTLWLDQNVHYVHGNVDITPVP